jgi:hypothetical protein
MLQIGGMRGNAPRIAAFLARLDLERLITRHMLGRGWDVAGASMRSKLLCLRVVEPEVSYAADAAWFGLSRACHYHAFDLQPTASEAAHLIGLVRLVQDAIDDGA